MQEFPQSDICDRFCNARPLLYDWGKWGNDIFKKKGSETISKIKQDTSSIAVDRSCLLGIVNIWFYNHCNFALDSCRTVRLNYALTCSKQRIRAQWKPEPPYNSLDLSLVVEIATEGSDSKENKELGIKITSECPLEGCHSPSLLPCLQPVYWVLFHYKQCLSHEAFGKHKKRRNSGRKQNIRGLINGNKDKKRRGIHTHKLRDEFEWSHCERTLQRKDRFKKLGNLYLEMLLCPKVCKKNALCILMHCLFFLTYR